MKSKQLLFAAQQYGGCIAERRRLLLSRNADSLQIKHNKSYETNPMEQKFRLILSEMAPVDIP